MNLNKSTTKRYRITETNDPEGYAYYCSGESKHDAFRWIVNHLDTSIEYTIAEINN